MKIVIICAAVFLAVHVYTCPQDYSETADTGCNTSNLTCQANHDCQSGFQCCFGPNNVCDSTCWHPEHGHQAGNNNPGAHNPGNHNPVGR